MKIQLVQRSKFIKVKFHFPRIWRRFCDADCWGCRGQMYVKGLRWYVHSQKFKLKRQILHCDQALEVESLYRIHNAHSANGVVYC